MVKFVIRRIYIRYRLIGFKVCQAKFVIVVAQIYDWKVACRKNATFSSQHKHQWHVWTNTEFKQRYVSL